MRALSIAGWTYADLADRGIPVCGECDRDMELIHPASGTGSHVPCNAWIIVDTDDRSVLPTIYDEYGEAVNDANAMDNSLIVDLVLPARPSPQEPEEEQQDG